MNIPDSSFKRVVVIGAGFAGLRLARKLSKSSNYQVVLVDKHNYHTFLPLIYQVATAGLEPDSVANAVRTIFHHSENFYFRIANIERIDRENKIIHSNVGELEYDYLVIATGSTTNFYGNKNIENYAMTMKSVPEALDLRSLVLENLESALLTNDLNVRDRLMNFVIVGGGPTGVELAGAMGELKQHVLPNDYPDLDLRRMKVNLIQMDPKLLPTMSENASKKAHKYLESLGVDIWFNTSVKDYDGKTVVTNGKTFKTTTMIWTAGVKGNLIPGLDDDDSVKGSRYVVNEYNQLVTDNSIFAIGDAAGMFSEENPKGHPMLAQVAIQQGNLLAKNLKKMSLDKPLIPFKYKDKGSMATVGRNKAVVDFPNWKFNGWFAWIVWLFVHLMSLVGFRNKVVVFFNWVVQYFQYNKNVRLIIRPFKPKTKEVMDMIE